MVAAEQANIVERRDDLHMDLQADGAIRVSNEDFTAIVQHIVSNAFKFSKSGTPVEVGFVRENDDYVLTVKDYGIGMTPEQVNAIGAYMQFDRLIREQQGSGLGLAIVRRLVELYEGDFTITSVPDDHTIVTVRLPHAT
ncbi:MAG: ATP-binding protein [Chloroflexi bacterium]|nr:MAG: ATP-binding protein [Chloroflexota bacterium]